MDDHCCVNFFTNDKRNESGKDLSFFNFPSNKTQRSQWIAAIKRDEGPLFKVNVTSHKQQAVKCTRFTIVPDVESFSIYDSICLLFSHEIITQYISREKAVNYEALITRLGHFWLELSNTVDPRGTGLFVFIDWEMVIYILRDSLLLSAF